VADTIVIYTSDQGYFLGEHDYMDERWMFEQSLRMPFLIRYPGEIEPGTVIDDIILNVDYRMFRQQLLPPALMFGENVDY